MRRFGQESVMVPEENVFTGFTALLRIYFWNRRYGQQLQGVRRKLTKRGKSDILLTEKREHLMEDPQGEITLLVGEIAAGSEIAKERLVALVYDKLHKMAGALMSRERSNHSLQPTALVHEAYFRLFVGKPLQAINRAYFFGAAANAMRQVLIDYARRIRARPEGKRVPLLDGIMDTLKGTNRVDILDLNNALEELKRMHTRQWEVVTLRFFGGLKWSEIGACLNVSTATAEKDWQAARAWLYSGLKGK